MSATAAAGQGTLRRDAIGLREVLFQSITAMAPGAAIAASIPAGAAFAGGALPLAVGIPAFSFVSPLAAPVSYAGPVVGVWMVAGLAYLGYLWVRHRQRVVDTGLVHLDAEPETSQPQTS